MTRSAQHDFLVEQGSPFTRRFRALDGNRELVHFGDYFLNLRISQFKEDTVPAFNFVESNASGWLVNNGTLFVLSTRNFGDLNFVVDLPASVTDQFAFSSLFYQIDLTPVTETAIPFGGGYTSLAIDKVDATSAPTANLTTLQANGGTPFTGIVANDYIRLYNCEDPLTNDTYFVQSKTDTSKKLHLGNVTLGADNASDTAVEVRLLTFDTERLWRLVEGTMQIDRRVPVL